LSRDVTIVAVNVWRRIAILDDDTVFALTNLYDDGGDETEDADDAASAVGQLPNGQWVAFPLSDFDDGTPLQ
jgi:hypothetical protein